MQKAAPVWDGLWFARYAMFNGCQKWLATSIYLRQAAPDFVGQRFPLVVFLDLQPLCLAYVALRFDQAAVCVGKDVVSTLHSDALQVLGERYRQRASAQPAQPYRPS